MLFSGNGSASGILPSQILPFAAGLVAMLFQIVLNVISQVFGL